MLHGESHSQNEADRALEDTFSPAEANELSGTKSLRGSKVGADEQHIESRSSNGFWKAVIKIMFDQRQYLSICMVLLVCCVIGGMFVLNWAILLSLL